MTWTDFLFDFQSFLLVLLGFAIAQLGRLWCFLLVVYGRFSRHVRALYVKRIRGARSMIGVEAGLSLNFSKRSVDIVARAWRGNPNPTLPIIHYITKNVENVIYGTAGVSLGRSTVSVEFRIENLD